MSPLTPHAARGGVMAHGHQEIKPPGRATAPASPSAHPTAISNPALPGGYEGTPKAWNRMEQWNTFFAHQSVPLAPSFLITYLQIIIYISHLMTELGGTGVPTVPSTYVHVMAVLLPLLSSSFDGYFLLHHCRQMSRQADSNARVYRLPSVMGDCFLCCRSLALNSSSA